MTETHVVYITREVADPLDDINPWKDVEIEVEVEVTRGHPGDYWTPPDGDEGVVLGSSHQLTESEADEAVEAAIEKPTPVEVVWDEEDPMDNDNEKPF
tara:strand:- start:1785 stop:2078 length:294 start_codon:yes stop_codon:yes gene_type:complete